MSDAICRNKYVSLNYRITDENGDTLESNDCPVNYVHGHDSEIIEAIEMALEGHVCGDEIEVSLTPEQGFGPYLPELCYTEELANVPEEFRKPGAEVEFENDQGETRIFRVTRIEQDTLTIDGNHPFAGKTITYHIRITAVRDATANEIANGAQITRSLH